MKEAFPEAFARAMDMGDNIADEGSWFNGEWSWKNLYNSDISATDAATQVDEINRILADIEPHEEDDYIWLADKSKGFTINSCYSKMIPCSMEHST